MRNVLRHERLPLPSVPEVFHDRITKLREWAWGTREETHPLYEVQSYVDEAVVTPVPKQDFVLIGHAGYGTNSWFFHSFISTQTVAVFVQSPWGGAYGDTKLAIEGLKLRYEFMEKIIRKTHAAVAAGLPLPGRLVVQQSSIAIPRWAWVQELHPVVWNEEFANAMTPALESLQKYL